MENGCNCTPHGKKPIWETLIGRKSIMLVLCIISAGVLNLVWDMDVDFIIYLYGAFAGGNSLEHFANRRGSL